MSKWSSINDIYSVKKSQGVSSFAHQYLLSSLASEDELRHVLFSDAVD